MGLGKRFTCNLPHIVRDHKIDMPIVRQRIYLLLLAMWTIHKVVRIAILRLYDLNWVMILRLANITILAFMILRFANPTIIVSIQFIIVIWTTLMVHPHGASNHFLPHWGEFIPKALPIKAIMLQGNIPCLVSLAIPQPYVHCVPIESYG